MLADVVGLYEQLQGISPHRAQMQYIGEVQLLQGYGLELFSAKVLRYSVQALLDDPAFVC